MATIARMTGFETVCVAAVQATPVILDATHARRPWRLAITQSLSLPAPVEWIGPDRRYVEKLATPDVTVADLIGDMDPIRAARGVKVLRLRPRV